MEKLERKTAETILQTPQKINIGENTYEVAPPTMATLIEVSKYIKTIPDIKIEDETKILTEALSLASESEYLGDVLAILVLGSKGIKQKKVVTKKFLFIKKKITCYPQKDLAEYIIENISPKELFNKIVLLLQSMEVGFFLNTIIFLNDVNLLRKTRS